jgi:hypothetical protein
MKVGSGAPSSTIQPADDRAYSLIERRLGSYGPFRPRMTICPWPHDRFTSIRSNSMAATNVRNPRQPRGASIDWPSYVVSRYRTGACQMPTPFQDGLLEVSASRLRACGATTADATSVVVRIKFSSPAITPSKKLGTTWSNVTSMGEHRYFHDDLPTCESASRLRASGAITPYTAGVVVCFGEGESVLRREVRVVHRKLRNGGSWSFFVCPQCARRARVLKLHDGSPKCWQCCRACGVRYRSANGSPVERDAARMVRMQKLRGMLHGGAARLHPRPGRRLDRRWSLTVSWRRGMIRERQDLLRLRREGLKLQ